MPEKSGGGFSGAAALLFAVAIAMLVVAAFMLRPWESGASKEAKKAEDTGSLLLLPRKTLDAAKILGRARAEVHAALGKPESSHEGIDTFRPGVGLDVRYDESGRASGLTLSAPHAGRNERAVRRWLRLPPAGPIELDGARYRVLPMTNPDHLAIVRAGAAPVAASAPAAPARAGLHSVLELVREFPKLPAFARAACRRSDTGEGPGLVCDGFDARVVYELGGTLQPETVTLLDPGGARDERRCAGVVDNALAGAVETERFESLGGGATQHYRGLAAEAFYIWEPAADGRPARCSVMLCRRGSGRASACAPPPNGLPAEGGEDP